MNVRRTAVALACTCSLLLASCASIPERPSRVRRGDYGYLKEYITWLVQKQMDRHKVVGASVALIDDQTLVWTRGFGSADKNGDIPATPETIYNVASLSKLFTATAVMQLVERGKIDLDRPVTDYIPEFRVKSRYKKKGPITVRMLMTHHSGLPSDWGRVSSARIRYPIRRRYST